MIFNVSSALIAFGSMAMAYLVRETGTFNACGTTYSYVVYVDWHGDTDSFYNAWADHVDALQAKASNNCNKSVVTISY